MDTISEVLAQLRKEGYVEDFNLQATCLVCRDGHFQVFHHEFVIDKFYRFEGESDPGDEAIVYAISSPKYDIKGVLINGGGIYADDITNEMVDSLKVVPQ